MTSCCDGVLHESRFYYFCGLVTENIDHWFSDGYRNLLDCVLVIGVC